MHRLLKSDPMLRPEYIKINIQSSCFIISLVIFLSMRIAMISESVMTHISTVEVVYLVSLLLSDVVPISYVLYCHIKSYQNISEQQFRSHVRSQVGYSHEDMSLANTRDDVVRSSYTDPFSKKGTIASSAPGTSVSYMMPYIDNSKTTGCNNEESEVFSNDVNASLFSRSAGGRAHLGSMRSERVSNYNTDEHRGKLNGKVESRGGQGGSHMS